jgi:tRNA pseudouridine13 synthase
MTLDLPAARIKAAPEDFVVEEIPAYAPSGEGEHLYVRFTKRNLTTDIAVRAIANALKANGRDVGVAGMKDKIAVTTQTISLPIPRSDPDFEARAAALDLPGITIHEARRHGNKLKTGHLVGNRFDIRVRGIARAELEGALAGLARIAREGLPNAYGAQRFGRAGDNADRARRWLTGKDAGPRDPRMKRLWWSSLQSAAFNAVLQARVEDGTWTRPLLGDLL